MGGGGGKKQQQEPQASRELSQMAQQLFNQTSPIRDILIDDTLSFLGGDPSQTQPSQPLGQRSPTGFGGGPFAEIIGQSGLAPPSVGGETPPTQGLSAGQTDRAPFSFDSASTPEFRFAQQAANRQFDIGKNQVLENLPAGGALQQGLVDLSSQKASSLLGAESDIFNQNINRAYSLATGQPFTGGGLGTAAQVQGQTAAANAQQNAAAKGGIGTGIGYGMASGKGGAAGAGAGRDDPARVHARERHAVGGPWARR